MIGSSFSSCIRNIPNPHSDETGQFSDRPHSNAFVVISGHPETSSEL